MTEMKSDFAANNLTRGVNSRRWVKSLTDDDTPIPGHNLRGSLPK